MARTAEVALSEEMGGLLQPLFAIAQGMIRGMIMHVGTIEYIEWLFSDWKNHPTYIVLHGQHFRFLTEFDRELRCTKRTADRMVNNAEKV
jgi:hypothetical protein